MYAVLREIHFSYGHRLLDYQGKCARLHGHNARVQIELSKETLDALGMVMDFYKIRESMGQWIDATLDHRLILWDKDPLAKVLEKAGDAPVLIKQNPTAEALAKFIFDRAQKMGLPVSKVILWETENSCASYETNSPNRPRRMRQNP